MGDGRLGPIEERIGRRLIRLVDPQSEEGRALLDSGAVDLLGPEGERFGRIVVDRPEPQAMWQRRHAERWGKADAVFSGEASRALALLGPVLAQSGMSGVKLNNLVGTTLVGISLARAQLDRGVRGSSLERAVFNSLRQARPFGLGNWSAEASNWSRWAQDWPAARVAAGLRAALEIDIAFKSTTLRDEQALLTELILQLHNSRAERAA